MAWQQALVFLIVGAAVLYLAFRNFGPRKGACGGCDACPGSGQKPASAAENPAPGLVQLELTPPRRRPDPRQT